MIDAIVNAKNSANKTPLDPKNIPSTNINLMSPPPSEPGTRDNIRSNPPPSIMPNIALIKEI